MIAVTIYAWLSAMSTKTINIWSKITLGFFGLVHSATLFHFCNYAHYFPNIVSYQKTLSEHIQGYS